MAFPEHSKYVIIGAGIHGLSSAWRLAERLKVAWDKGYSQSDTRAKQEFVSPPRATY